VRKRRADGQIKELRCREVPRLSESGKEGTFRRQLQLCCGESNKKRTGRSCDHGMPQGKRRLVKEEKREKVKIRGVIF